MSDHPTVIPRFASPPTRATNTLSSADNLTVSRPRSRPASRLHCEARPRSPERSARVARAIARSWSRLKHRVFVSRLKQRVLRRGLRSELNDGGLLQMSSVAASAVGRPESQC
jgi:hypothetical protein